MSNEIYNIDIKQKYIDIEIVDDNKKILTFLFKRIGEFERKLEKDIFEMSESELIELISFLKLNSRSYRSNIMSFINSYNKWAFRQGLSNENIIISSETFDLATDEDNYKQVYLFSYKQIDDIFKPLESMALYNKFRQAELAVRLLYIGISLEEISSLKKKDLNKKLTIIKTNKRSYFIGGEMYNRIYELWRHCSTMDYIEKIGVKDKIKTTKTQLVDSEYLLRPTIIEKQKDEDNERLNKLRLESFFRFVSKNYYKLTGNIFNIKAKNILESGRFNKLYQIELSGKEFTNEDFCQIFNFNIKSKSLNQKISNKKIDYLNWKIAFDL